MSAVEDSLDEAQRLLSLVKLAVRDIDEWCGVPIMAGLDAVEDKLKVARALSTLDEAAAA